jgi:hypothetical protein
MNQQSTARPNHLRSTLLEIKAFITPLLFPANPAQTTPAALPETSPAADEAELGAIPGNVKTHRRPRSAGVIVTYYQRFL